MPLKDFLQADEQVYLGKVDAFFEKNKIKLADYFLAVELLPLFEGKQKNLKQAKKALETVKDKQKKGERVSSEELLRMEGELKKCQDECDAFRRQHKEFLTKFARIHPYNFEASTPEELARMKMTSEQESLNRLGLAVQELQSYITNYESEFRTDLRDQNILTFEELKPYMQIRNAQKSEGPSVDFYPYQRKILEDHAKNEVKRARPFAMQGTQTTINRFSEEKDKNIKILKQKSKGFFSISASVGLGFEKKAAGKKLAKIEPKLIDLTKKLEESPEYKQFLAAQSYLEDLTRRLESYERSLQEIADTRGSVSELSVSSTSISTSSDSSSTASSRSGSVDLSSSSPRSSVDSSHEVFRVGLFHGKPPVEGRSSAEYLKDIEELSAKYTNEIITMTDNPRDKSALLASLTKHINEVRDSVKPTANPTKEVLDKNIQKMLREESKKLYEVHESKRMKRS